jgi:hypothetical protein
LLVLKKTECSDLQLMHSAKICSVESSLAKSDVLESKTRGSSISSGSDDLGKTVMIEPEDWRAPLVCYLENPGHAIDRKVQRQALTYILLDHDLYR